MKTSAIVLAAGQGKRMGSDVAKQYLLLVQKKAAMASSHYRYSHLKQNSSYNQTNLAVE